MDAVSGATYTSGGYLTFLQAALTPRTFDDDQDTSGYATSGQRGPCRRSRQGSSGRTRRCPAPADLVLLALATIDGAVVVSIIVLHLSTAWTNRSL